MNPDTPQPGKRAGKSSRTGSAGAESGTASTGPTVGQAGAGAAADATTASAGAEHDASNESDTSGLIDQVKSKAAAQISAQKDKATAGLGSVASAVRETGRQLREQHHDGVAEYVERAADRLDRFSSHLRERDLAQLVDEAQQLARQQPAWFIGSSFAVGLLAGRFIKSSRPERESRGGEWTTGGESVYGGGESTRSGFTAASGPGSSGDAGRGSY